MSKTIEERVQVLEDIEEIRAVHARYHDCVDKGWDGKLINPDGLRECFTDDITWGGTQEVYTDDLKAAGKPDHTGIENVLVMLEEATSPFDMTMHSFLNEIITVDGDQATGRRSDWVAVTRDGVVNMWFLKASSQYVRTDAGWRIRSVNVRFVATLVPGTTG